MIFKNKEIEADWCEYHLKEANLRLLCVPCHDKKTYKRNDSLQNNSKLFYVYRSHCIDSRLANRFTYSYVI